MQLNMVMYGYVWLCMVMYGYVWLCMVTYGYSMTWCGDQKKQSLMVIYGYMYGYQWLCMVI